MRKRFTILVGLIVCFLSNYVFAENIPLPEHPRPDFERSNWINLNGEWDFTFDKQKGEKAIQSKGATDFEYKIKVPFSWGSPLSGVPNEGDQGWYTRSVTIPKEWEGKRIYLIIGASEWDTQAWLNGTPIGNHKGGYTPFEFELTEHITAYGQPQNLVISADDTANDKRLGGKQGYGNARGIWQTIYLEARGKNFIDYVHFSPDIDRSVVKVEVGLNQLLEKANALRLHFQNGEQADFIYTPKGKARKSLVHTFEVKLENQQLWDLDNPYLYEMEMALTDNTQTVDAVKTYFGQRKISVTNLPGTTYPYISLNDKPVYLQLCLDQSYHPEGYYTFPSDAFMREEIMLSKRLGLNGNRIHIKVELPRKLYWADRLGLLIMADVPNWWGDIDEFAKNDWLHCMRQQIKRDYNHPSIFSWVDFNETWGLFTKIDGQKIYKPETQEWVREMYHLTKQLDPTRLVDENSPVHHDHVESDLNSWHIYLPGYAWEDTLKHFCNNTFPGSNWNYIGNNKQANAPMFNSECGNVWGYKGSTGDVDLTWDYHQMINTFRAYPQCSGWLYTEHHDVINEWNGYVRYDRTSKTFGLDAFVPNMTITDFHSPYYIAPRCKLMQEVQAGSQVEIPLFLSAMTDKTPGTMSVETSIAGWNEVGQEIKEISVGRSTVDFKPYMNELIQPAHLTLPQQNGLYVVRFVLRGKAGNVLNRNFVLYRVRDGKKLSDVQPVLQLSFAPKSYSQAQWSMKQWNVMDGKKVNGAGNGFFEYQVQLPTDLDLDKIENVVLAFEASAKTLFGKDKEGANIEHADLDFMVGKGTYDPCKNPNSYAQTDERKFPSQIQVTVNGKTCGMISLEDDPADHRGALSWFSQEKNRRLQEAGSYGYLIEVNVPKEALQAGGTATVRFEVPQGCNGGLALYGEDFGRYPMDPTFIFNLKK